MKYWISCSGETSQHLPVGFCLMEMESSIVDLHIRACIHISIGTSYHTVHTTEATYLSSALRDGKCSVISNNTGTLFMFQLRETLLHYLLGLFLLSISLVSCRSDKGNSFIRYQGMICSFHVCCGANYVTD